MAIEKKISKYKENGAKVFTGRDKGIEARKELRLDEIEDSNSLILILLPSDTWNVNPSFFGGLFETSIKKYGENFHQHYSFAYNNHKDLNESLRKNIESDIDYILRKVGGEV